MDFSSLACGMCGALASICGKLALSDSFFISTIEHICKEKAILYCSLILLFFRVVLFCGMAFSNGLMVSFFLKALDKNSTIHVTVVSSGINYVTTGVCGLLLLQESISMQWFCGSLLILIGVGIIAKSQSQEKNC